MADSPNQQVYRRFVDEVINGGNTDVIPELFDPGYLDHSAPPGAGGDGDVFAQVAQIPGMFRGAFPDVHFTINQMIEQGDWVATRVTGSGQHLGRPFMGIPATGRRVTWGSMGMFRIANGKIAEHYGAPDLMGLHAQLVAPAQPGSVDQARATVARLIHELNSRNDDGVDQVVDREFTEHDPIPGQGPGVAGLKQAQHMLNGGFSNLWFMPLDMVAEGDMVIVRGAFQGTHDGTFIGVPATNRPMGWTASRMFRVRDGKIVEGWQNVDMIALLGQLGLVPQMQPA
jgi:predicted ester cyclase